MAVLEHTLADFGGLTVLYDAEVLRPRPWTIAQSTWSAEILRSAPDGPVLELCAGVGHIGLAAVADGRRALVLADLNPAACALAQRNADAALMGQRVDVREGRMETVLDADERFPLIIADPPWVPSAGIAEFPEDPSIAIDGGIDGLDLARTCCSLIDNHLADGGSAVVQLGSIHQLETIAEYLENELESTLRVVEVRTYDRGILAQLCRQVNSAG